MGDSTRFPYRRKEENSSNILSHLIYRKEIAINGDFPVPPIHIGYWYRATASVTDVTTGQSFINGDEFYWNGKGWTFLGNIYYTGSPSIVIPFTGITGDTTFTNLIPPGYKLVSIIFNEKAGRNPILDLGITAGGNEIFINQSLNSLGLTLISYFNIFSLTLFQTLYLNDDDVASTWDGSTIDIYFELALIVTVP